MKLDGVNDYAKIPDNASLDLGDQEGEDFTIEAFFYVPDQTSDATQVIFHKRHAYSLTVNFNPATPDAIFVRVYVGPRVTDSIQLRNRTSLSSGWHHIAAVFDNEWTVSNDRLAIYLDGAEFASNNAFEYTPGIYGSTKLLSVGPNSHAEPFNGWLDEARFSDVVRYSGAYPVPTSEFAPDDNTRALWHFNDAPCGSSFRDSSGNGNTLTGQNGATTGLQGEPSPTLQFSSATYSTAEGGGSTSITVTRSGDPLSSVAVNHTTSDRSATAGTDYSDSDGTLNLSCGEMERTFSVPIATDALVEGAEKVALGLDTPTGGASLGSPSSATLTIEDQDLTPPDTSTTSDPSGPTNDATPAEAPDRPPSILLIVTDDQRWDTLGVMRKVHGRLARRGITFTDGYTTNPSCCPSRASMLTGLYSHNTGVWANNGPYGGFDDFDDTSTLATWLDDAGYRTGLFGKYLNGYSWQSQYVPPGWDTWFAKSVGYYNYTVAEAEDGDLSVVEYGDDPSDYSTRVLTRRSRAFLSSTPAETPFFAVVAYTAPHHPALPDVRDLDAFPDLRPYRPPSFNERDVSDKPSYVARLQPLTRSKERAVDTFRRDQLRTLLSVDRGIDQLLSMLRSLGRLNDTMVVLTSDHGYQWGEHRWVGKGYPYEESIRVPLVVRYDPLVQEPGGHTSRLVLGIDLAPTIAQIAGVAIPPVDGASFASLLADPGAAFRNAFIVEHRSEHPRWPTFCAVRLRGRWSFVRYYVDEAVSEIEMYDLRRDRYQLRNVARDRRYADERAMLRAEADDRCVVPPA